MWFLHPYAFGVEETQFLGSRIFYRGILEDLACQVVLVVATETLRRAADETFDVGIVVPDLHAEASVLEEGVVSALLGNAPKYGLA